MKGGQEKRELRFQLERMRPVELGEVGLGVQLSPQYLRPAAMAPPPGGGPSQRSQV